MGVLPYGVDKVTSKPAAVNVLCGLTNSSAQNPVGCGLPSFIVHTLEPVMIIAIEVIVPAVPSPR